MTGMPPRAAATLQGSVPDRIDRPIFVMGTGRCGTSLFFQLLGFHTDLAWFSTYGTRFPRATWPALLSRLRDLPGIDRILPTEGRYTPKPTESYGILNAVTGGLFTAERRLEAGDATPEIRRRFRTRVSAHLRLQGKPRFTNKHTGFARTDFLHAIFPTARFIHVYRDGREVACSLARVDWWNELDLWHWGPMRADYAEDYRRSGEDRLVLAAITWKTLMDAIEEECRNLPPGRLLRVRYDRLVKDVTGVLREVLRFAELPERSRFWQRVERHAVRDAGRKHYASLDAGKRALLERHLAEHLPKYGFAP